MREQQIMPYAHADYRYDFCDQRVRSDVHRVYECTHTFLTLLRDHLFAPIAATHGFNEGRKSTCGVGPSEVPKPD